MAPPRRPTPSYLEHKASGKARAVWTDAAGTRHDRLLPGAYGTEESRKAFGRLLLELEVGPQPAQLARKNGLTVAELLLAYLQHAQRHYRDPDGRPTSTMYEIKIVLKALRELYGDTSAAEFGPLALKAARQGWVAEGRSRSECNRRAGIIKRIFKWGVSEELVPATVHQALCAVIGLQRGRTIARETEPVGPVEDAVVDATLPHLNRFVAAMVELQRLTGMRPGEVCLVRRCDIDTGGAVWLYRPERHKTAYRGKSRVIAIGPKGQQVAKEFFTPDRDAYLFSPHLAVEEGRAEAADKRKTPRYPSHQKRNAAKRKAKPRRVSKERYDRTSYSRAIARAVVLANATRVAAKKAEIPHWHPNQLRHTFATHVRKAHGLEAAQVLLGHSRADVTQVYAERNEELAKTIAAKIG